MNGSEVDQVMANILCRDDLTAGDPTYPRLAAAWNGLRAETRAEIKRGLRGDEEPPKAEVFGEMIGTIRPTEAIHAAHWFLDFFYANRDREMRFDPKIEFLSTEGCNGKFGNDCCSNEFEFGVFVEELARATGYEPKVKIDPNAQYDEEQVISEVPLVVDGVRKLVKTVRSPLGPVQVIDGTYRTPIGPFASYAEYLAEFRAGLARSHPKA